MQKKKNRKVFKIEVDRELCIGAGPCVAVSPNSFKLDKEGKAVVKKSFSKVADNEILIAAQSCPVQAIFLYDEKGKQIFP